MDVLAKTGAFFRVPLPRRPAVIAAFSPFGSMTKAEPLYKIRFGTISDGPCRRGCPRPSAHAGCRPADQPVFATAEQQSLSTVFPRFSGYFLGVEPARRQGALASERFLRRKTAREVVLEPCFEIVVRQNASTFFLALNAAILLENGPF